LILGKSSLGNLLTGFSDEAQHFIADESFESVTKQCAVGSSTFNDKSIVVIDTPGFFDTKCTTSERKKKKVNEITKSVQKSYPGPHVFFIVLKVGRYTVEEQQAIEQIKKIFGPQILNFCVVIFTGKFR
jgi:GTPase Era involved in 16S rRNA processing